MKRPSKKPQQSKVCTTLIEEDVPYSPEDLRAIAGLMEDRGFTQIQIELWWGYEDPSFDCMATKIETKEEAEARYKKEYAAYKKYKEKEKVRKEEQAKEYEKHIAKEAKRLGLLDE